MDHLSDESIKKVLSSLKYERDNVAMEELRKCCYRLNNIIVSNDFHKIDAYTLRCFWSPTQQKMITNMFDVKWHLLPKTVKDMKENGTFEESDIFYYEIENQRRIRHINPRLLQHRWRMEKNKKEVPREEPREAFSKDNLLLTKHLQRSIQNMASTKLFLFTNLTLNSVFLEIIKQHEAVIRSATMVGIDSCKMEWSSDELLQFLKMFKSLKRLSLLYASFTETIITDEHISLVSEKIEVVNNRNNDTLHFPHITSQSCKTWLKKDMKFVVFRRISSDISYSDVKEYMDALVEKANPVNNDWFRLGGTTPNFGVLKYCEDDLRQIVLSQRKRNIDWTIEPNERYKKYYTVTATGMKYKFRVDIPYLPPDFQKLLIVVIKLQTKLEGDDVIDENEQKEMEYQLDDVRNDLYYYKKAKNLLNEIIPAPEEPQNERNDAVEQNLQMEWRIVQLGRVRNYANQIRYRIRQLEEKEKIAA